MLQDAFTYCFESDEDAVGLQDLNNLVYASRSKVLACEPATPLVDGSMTLFTLRGLAGSLFLVLWASYHILVGCW
ncbi:hypothetical protein BDV30DRAFT_116003 [Aspergillus minisclerotigenes]|uniref:Uncharacterized protein n=1 Tax=Aspergillus minisclerotigenes TaxID=656917 RepID=A0A5N6J4C0_9EURO|nr:hypothetical protein BDV30DRAFT_116003 [Aspergillus minisclerotigenes]